MEHQWRGSPWQLAVSSAASGADAPGPTSPCALRTPGVDGRVSQVRAAHRQEQEATHPSLFYESADSGRHRITMLDAKPTRPARAPSDAVRVLGNHPYAAQQMPEGWLRHGQCGHHVSRLDQIRSTQGRVISCCHMAAPTGTSPTPSQRGLDCGMMRDDAG